ncbi:MAG: hypothetical protein LIO65_04700 [Odoribacter sp.]|nr:hypothetical protein [Odoribacter sp.]
MRILLIVCYLLAGSLLWAQEEKSYHFDYFTLEDGLPNNRVHCILQDSEGWMWFGTSNGLSRFDGVNFKVYKHDRYEVETLGANLVRTIFEDSNHKL